jgi:hypothetical protein
MLLHILNITIWSGCIRRMAINHRLNLKIPLGMCPVGLDQNTILMKQDPSLLGNMQESKQFQITGNLLEQYPNNTNKSEMLFL